MCCFGRGSLVWVVRTENGGLTLACPESREKLRLRFRLHIRIHSNPLEQSNARHRPPWQLMKAKNLRRQEGEDLDWPLMPREAEIVKLPAEW
jgi:hypothetical protein